MVFHHENDKKSTLQILFVFYNFLYRINLNLLFADKPEDDIINYNDVLLRPGGNTPTKSTNLIYCKFCLMKSDHVKYLLSDSYRENIHV